MITIGAYVEDGKTYYYAVVRGRASRRSYPGLMGLLKAVAEAHYDEELNELEDYWSDLLEFRRLARKKEFKESLEQIGDGYGLTITLNDAVLHGYSFTEKGGAFQVKADGVVPSLVFDMPEDVVEFLSRPSYGRGFGG